MKQLASAGSFVPRMPCGAISAFTRVFYALWACGVCAADPWSILFTIWQK